MTRGCQAPHNYGSPLHRLQQLRITLLVSQTMACCAKPYPRGPCPKPEVHVWKLWLREHCAGGKTMLLSRLTEDPQSSHLHLPRTLVRKLLAPPRRAADPTTREYVASQIARNLSRRPSYMCREKGFAHIAAARLHSNGNYIICT